MSEFTMALIWVKGKLGQALFTFLSICCCTSRAKIDTRLHVKYVANSLKYYSFITVLHNSKGARRFGDMMMTTTTTAIIVVETMYVGLTLSFLSKYSLMLVSEMSLNALFFKTITKIHCSIVGFCLSYQYFFENH